MKQSRREAQEPEPIKIRGNLVLLKEAVAVAGLNGKWLEKPNGVWRYRCDDRAGLNWSRTVWFDGPLRLGRNSRGLFRLPCGTKLVGCIAEEHSRGKEGRTSRFSGRVK